MQSTCGSSIAARIRSVGLRSNDVWSEATTQSSSASTLAGTSTSPLAVMFASTPRSTRNGFMRAFTIVDLLPLLLDAALPEVVRVIGQAQEGVAARRRRRGHLLDRRLSVRRPRRVAVHLAAQVAELDELRQRPSRAASSSPAVLAQLRRDELVAQERVQRLLVAEGVHLARLDHRDAVLGDREAAPLRLLPQGDVVLLRAR